MCWTGQSSWVHSPHSYPCPEFSRQGVWNPEKVLLGGGCWAWDPLSHRVPGDSAGTLCGCPMTISGWKNPVKLEGALSRGAKAQGARGAADSSSGHGGRAPSAPGRGGARRAGRHRGGPCENEAGARGRAGLGVSAGAEAGSPHTPPRAAAARSPPLRALRLPWGSRAAVGLGRPERCCCCCCCYCCRHCWPPPSLPAGAAPTGRWRVSVQPRGAPGRSQGRVSRVLLRGPLPAGALTGRPHRRGSQRLLLRAVDFSRPSPVPVVFGVSRECLLTRLSLAESGVQLPLV